MQRLTKAAQLVFQHHQEKGANPSYAGHLVGHFPGLLDEQALAAAYAELLESGHIEVAHEAIGQAGNNHFRTVYRFKSP